MTPPDTAAPAKTPARLYRYRPARKREIDLAFGKGQLHFATRSRLRDPFEGAPELLPATREEIEEHVRAREEAISPKDKKRLAAFRRKVQRRIDSLSFLEKVYREATERYGILALSEHLHEPLLWAQRADRHRGFCLEFDCSEPRSMPIGPAFRVLYTEERPQVAPLQLADQAQDEFLRQNYRYKPRHWSFEGEWRAFSSEGEGKRAFPRRLLRAVYLGGAATPQTRNAIVRKLAAWSEADRPRVYVMVLRTGGFALEAVPIEGAG